MALRKKKITHKKQVFVYYTKKHVNVYENFDDAKNFAEQAEGATHLTQYGTTHWAILRNGQYLGEINKRPILN